MSDVKRFPNYKKKNEKNVSKLLENGSIQNFTVENFQWILIIIYFGEPPETEQTFFKNFNY